ncbi:XdhC family protein [Amycolatopsis minnesotensis]|uniref:XdhC family protein n=1 Tax=Amycolatopsis minnesotensis TaxID=337894 RepID=A0ABN2S2T0_9PSEU
MTDPCAVAHGESAPPEAGRVLVAVFDSPVAEYLLRYGEDLGYETILVDPAGETTAIPALDERADVVVTNHHRPELGAQLQAALAQPARWIGVLGNPRHPGPHVEALRALGVPDEEIARVHRPVGLNIGSRTPPEIAIATLAGLLADRNDRPGGFAFPAP